MNVVGDEVVEAARELRKIRALLRNLGEEEGRLRTVLLQALGEDDTASGMTASGIRVAHVETQHRRRVNRAKLEAMFPATFEKVVEDSTVRIVKVDLPDDPDPLGLQMAKAAGMAQSDGEAWS